MIVYERCPSQYTLSCNNIDVISSKDPVTDSQWNGNCSPFCWLYLTMYKTKLLNDIETGSLFSVLVNWFINQKQMQVLCEHIQ